MDDVSAYLIWPQFWKRCLCLQDFALIWLIVILCCLSRNLKVTLHWLLVCADLPFLWVPKIYPVHPHGPNESLDENLIEIMFFNNVSLCACPSHQLLRLLQSSFVRYLSWHCNIIFLIGNVLVHGVSSYQVINNSWIIYYFAVLSQTKLSCGVFCTLLFIALSVKDFVFFIKKLNIHITVPSCMTLV